MNALVFDIGNTRIKYGLFQHGKFIAEGVLSTSEEAISFAEDNNPEAMLVCSVGTAHTAILEHFPQAIGLTPETPLPITNNYGTPKTLGPDRLAGVVGARSIFPNDPCLVIDLGTCITYDFINEAGTYQGGGISPGMNLRYRALHEFTAKLPLLSFEDFPELIGSDTRSSMQSGVVNGLIAELDGIIDQYLQKHPKLKVLFCGGDASLFESRTKHRIFTEKALVLKGLFKILSSQG